jgi:AraC family transcriptional regulator of adaptative response/methylated-DNA-[protein]-cysteine methyltransferase
LSELSVFLFGSKKRVGGFGGWGQNVGVNDYERIARVIGFLDERFVEQPSLGELARVAGMSESHFHRLFTSWAGVTPKDFLQCLTVAHAREALKGGASVLDAAVEAGLSGPGRLHDLCVSLEAASPGELKARGAGQVVRFGFAETPFGRWLCAENERGICHLEFGDGESLEGLREGWGAARLVRDDGAAERVTKEVFSEHQRKEGPLRAFVRGTEFQVRVWRALLRIPTGALVSYGQIAEAIGKPSASRAVGAAVGANSLAYLIPCHRVIRETGVIGEYRWGNVRKRAMVGWEVNCGLGRRS